MNIILISRKDYEKLNEDVKNIINELINEGCCSLNIEDNIPTSDLLFMN